MTAQRHSEAGLRPGHGTQLFKLNEPLAKLINDQNHGQGQRMMVPFIAFLVLLVVGVWLQELEIKHALVFVLIWGVGLVVFYLIGWPRHFYVAVEAILACLLVMLIFKGDLRIR